MVNQAAQAALEVLEDQVDPEDLEAPEAQVSIYCSKTRLNTNIFSNSRTTWRTDKPTAIRCARWPTRTRRTRRTR